MSAADTPPTGIALASLSHDAHEFPAESTGDKIVKGMTMSARIGKVALSSLTEPRPLLSLSAATATVYGIGLVEAMLLSKRPFNYRFLHRYASAQCVPSIIWLSKPVDAVVRAMGLTTAEVLAPAAKSEVVNAQRQLRIQTVQALRSIVAGFVGISEILRFVEEVGEATSNYMDRVDAGREPFFARVRERVVRLAGTDSDVTHLSMDRYGEHIVPVVEVPANARPIVRRHSTGQPVIWHLPSGKYGSTRHGYWDGFRVERDWLLKTERADGARALVIEADSSVGDEALALGEDSANDLTLQEASQGFRMIERIARREGALGKKDIVYRVLLADSASKVVSGGGTTVTWRRHVEERLEADVFIDCKMPLVKAILAWAEQARANSSNQSRTIVFDTSNADYFATLKRILKRHGWTVVDSTRRVHAGAHAARPAQIYNDVPMLVYHDSTPDTVNTIKSLVGSGACDVNRCCALLDSNEGVQELAELNDELAGDAHGQVASVCSAVIYDNLFAFVRRRIRAGDSAAAIQAQVDELVFVDP